MSKEVEEEIKKPIGSFMLEQKDIYSIPTNTGAHYHYSDVCKLLKRYHQSKLNEVSEKDIESMTHEINDAYCDETGWRALDNAKFEFTLKWLLNKLKKG